MGKTRITAKTGIPQWVPAVAAAVSLGGCAFLTTLAGAGLQAGTLAAGALEATAQGGEEGRAEKCDAAIKAFNTWLKTHSTEASYPNLKKVTQYCAKDKVDYVHGVLENAECAKGVAEVDEAKYANREQRDAAAKRMSPRCHGEFGLGLLAAMKDRHDESCQQAQARIQELAAGPSVENAPGPTAVESEWGTADTPREAELDARRAGPMMPFGDAEALANLECPVERLAAVAPLMAKIRKVREDRAAAARMAQCEMLTNAATVAISSGVSAHGEENLNGLDEPCGKELADQLRKRARALQSEAEAERTRAFDALASNAATDADVAFAYTNAIDKDNEFAKRRAEKAQEALRSKLAGRLFLLRKTAFLEAYDFDTQSFPVRIERWGSSTDGPITSTRPVQAGNANEELSYQPQRYLFKLGERAAESLRAQGAVVDRVEIVAQYVSTEPVELRRYAQNQRGQVTAQLPSKYERVAVMTFLALRVHLKSKGGVSSYDALLPAGAEYLANRLIARRPFDGVIAEYKVIAAKRQRAAEQQAKKVAEAEAKKRKAEEAKAALEERRRAAAEAERQRLAEEERVAAEAVRVAAEEKAAAEKKAAEDAVKQRADEERALALQKMAEDEKAALEAQQREAAEKAAMVTAEKSAPLLEAVPPPAKVVGNPPAATGRSVWHLMPLVLSVPLLVCVPLGVGAGGGLVAAAVFLYLGSFETQLGILYTVKGDALVKVYAMAATGAAGPLVLMVTVLGGAVGALVTGGAVVSYVISGGGVE